MILVSNSLVAAARPDTAFPVCTAELSRSWPPAAHHLGATDAARVAIEPGVGGSGYGEIATHGRADAAIGTEVEVRCVAVAGGTGVEPTHRELDAHGDAAETMRGSIDSEGGGAGRVGAFAAVVA